MHQHTTTRIHADALRTATLLALVACDWPAAKRGLDLLSRPAYLALLTEQIPCPVGAPEYVKVRASELNAAIYDGWLVTL